MSSHALPNLTLAIEVSNPSSAGSEWEAVAVGVVEEAGVQVLASVPLRARDRHDDALMPALDEACRIGGVTPSDLARIAVSIGPGGFTGLRIAVTTAKMLSLVHGTACIAVPTARALVRRVSPTAFEDGPVLVALGWKRDSIWVEQFASPTRREAAGLHPISDLNLEGCGLLICDERLFQQLNQTFPDRSPRAWCEPVFDAAAVLEASVGLAPTDALSFSPLYPREPEAVTKWRELHGDRA